MQSKSKIGKNGKYVSIGLTFAIVIMMVLSGPVSAVSLGITDLDGTSHTKGDSVTFNVTATIEDTDSHVPIDNLSLKITGATSKEVVFSTDGTILSGDAGIKVVAVSVPYPIDGSDHGYGYGYGYDSFGYGHSFGYGYGYGYDNSAGGQDLVYQYTVTLHTSTFNTGVHEAVLSLNTGNEAKPSFGSSVASFTIEKTGDGPKGGFVTGGGWITSPAGAYTEDPELTGKVNFGFVSKYAKGASVPTGSTQFQFREADLKFHSDEYQLLVIADSKAQYNGTGTINGEGDYGFILTAIDGDIKGDGIDKIGIKIWDRSSDAIIYDNMIDAEDCADPTTAIGGGSIKIHKGDGMISIDEVSTTIDDYHAGQNSIIMVSEMIDLYRMGAAYCK
jgi:hypothetical protein